MSEKPEPPGDYECCDSGCDPCVWDIYFEDLKEWKENEIALNKEPANKEQGNTGADNREASNRELDNKS